jgi:hypothetical protein
MEGVQSLWSNSAELAFWVFGGPLLIVATLVRLVFPRFHWQEALLFLLLVTVPLGYVFFWGPYNIGTVWGAMSYLGPFYYFPVLVPITLLGTWGVLRLGTKTPLLVVLLLFAMTSVDFWLVFAHVSDNYKYTQEDRAIYRPFSERTISNALVFVPPIYGDFLLHPFAILGNNPTLDGSVIYAIDRGAEDFDLMDHYSDRRPYKFVYQGEYTEEPDDSFDTELVRLQAISSHELVQEITITNPTDKPYVYTYIWNNGKTETYLLDDSSGKGSDYHVRWKVTPHEITLEGPYIGKSRSEIDSISDSQPLVFSVAFTDTPERTSQVIYERRFSFRLVQDNLMEVIFPAEEWQNPDWPTGNWLRADIGAVMRDTADPAN